MRTLVFGWMSDPDNTLSGLTELAATLGTNVSQQALDKRFTESVVAFMKRIVEIMINFVISAQESVDWELTRRFPHVYVHDSTQISLPIELIDLWKGCGNTEKKAALKVDLLYDLNTGKARIHLRHGHEADNKSPLLDEAVEAGSVHLKDLGYYKLDRLKEQGMRGEYYVSLLQYGTLVYQNKDDEQAIDVQALMQKYRKQDIRYAELDVFIGARKKLKTRLIATRLSEEAAARNRAQVIKKAKDKGRTASDAQLALCDFYLMITNVPTDVLRKEEVAKLYGARWQIELIFKLWKSEGKIDVSRSRNPWRILCEVYVKLLIVTIQHWIFLTGFWKISQRSLVKGAHVIQKHAYCLAKSVSDLDKLMTCLQDINHALSSRSCLQNKRKTKPSTWQRMSEIVDKSVI